MNSGRPGSFISIMRTGLLLLLAALASGCTSKFFYPDTRLFDSPDRYGLKYQVEHLQAADGTRLTAWFFPAQARGQADGKPRATVLFLHGNAQNISTHFHNIAWLPAEGYNVLALDYRGYGASEGEPSLAGAQLDIDAAMHSLLAHEGVDPQRIVIFGQSLGAALTLYYAAHSTYRANVRAVIADSSFYDYRRIAREKLAGFWLTWPFQWLPWLVIDDDYSPAQAIGGLSPLPLLLIQGDRDAVVALAHGQELFDHAAEPKELWIVSGAGHIQSLDSSDVRKRLLGYLNQHTR